RAVARLGLVHDHERLAAAATSTSDPQPARARMNRLPRAAWRRPDMDERHTRTRVSPCHPAGVRAEPRRWLLHLRRLATPDADDVRGPARLLPVLLPVPGSIVGRTKATRAPGARRLRARTLAHVGTSLKASSRARAVAAAPGSLVIRSLATWKPVQDLGR